MKYILPILLLIFLSSCITTSTKYNQKETILLEAKFGKKNILLDTLTFEVFKKNDTINYQYLSKTNKTYNNILIQKIEKNDSLFIYNKKECRLINKVKFIIDGIEIEVFKYLYDEEISIDEEIEFYFTKENGIIISNPSGVGKYVFNTRVYSELQDSVLINKDKFESSFKIKTK